MSWKLILIFIFLILVLPECKKCLDCDEIISCEGIGWLKFRSYKDSDEGSNVSELKEDCDFENLELEEYAIQSCKGGLKLFGHKLISVHLSYGWTGKTDRGLKIGDALEQFEMLYPEATVDTLLSYKENKVWKTSIGCCDICREMKVYFDENERIRYIIVH